MPSSVLDTLNRIINRFTTVQRVVDGNQVLWFYYGLILVFFLFDIFFRAHVHKMAKNGNLNVEDGLVRFFKIYTKHGFILVNIILYIFSIILTIANEGFNFDFLITVTLSLVIFTLLMKLLLAIFVNEDSYKNAMFYRSLNIVCYMILGNYFVFFVPFIKYPHLITAFTGLMVGLAFCFYIMIQAIFNPEILRENDDNNEKYAEAFGILKGMLAVLVCILLLEYMMVYATFRVHPELYQTGEGRILNGWDMLYFLIISFTTIGYGDVYPVRMGGMFYAEYASIIIGLTSMFISACFISAVISTANGIAQSNKKKNSTEDEDSFEKLLSESEKDKEKKT